MTTCNKLVALHTDYKEMALLFTFNFNHQMAPLVDILQLASLNRLVCVVYIRDFRSSELNGVTAIFVQ